MDEKGSAGRINGIDEGEILSEQVSQVYRLAPLGMIATIVNSSIVFFVIKGIIPHRALLAWLSAILAVTAIRIVQLVKFRRSGCRGSWRACGNRFLSGLVLSGLTWGSIGALPAPGISLVHLVFIAFVLGGMAAGAAATFSPLKTGYLAYSIPALLPVSIRFLYMRGDFHFAMAVMIFFFGLLLWRVSLHSYRVNRSSLLLRQENRGMIARLERARSISEDLNRKLTGEMDAKIKAEDELRAYQGQLERTIEKRTADLRKINLRLEAEIEGRKKLEQEIMHQAHHDSLTGLPNRRLFTDLINFELVQARRKRKGLALLFLDLDRFKEINDTFGHNAGDELLKEVSRRIRASIRETDTAARIGGDEFNIILSDVTRTEDITPVVRKIMGSLKRPFIIAGYEVHVTASIGISVYPHDGEEIDTLYRYADIAMYHAKERGRNNFQFYNPEINLRSVERIRLETFLRQAFTRGELVVHYQPLVDIRAKQMVCAEALVRWQHPELGMIQPDRFIPIAEETGVITFIDEWVLGAVCSQIRAWQEAGLESPCIAVNLSSRQFQRPELVDRISDNLRESGISPDCIDIEITETMAMSNIELTAVRLREFGEMGMHVSIDDFGTGYSSLNYLKRLPIERLKIDKSFIQDIATDPDDRAIINAVTAMAHNMKIKVIAEGVETEEQLLFLQDTLCDEAQGFLFSKPLPPDEFRELIHAK